MYIDIVNYFMTKNPNTIIASCDTCRHIYSITADEIEILSGNKTNYKIYMFTCPNCGERLILPEKEMSKFFDEPKTPAMPLANIVREFISQGPSPRLRGRGSKHVGTGPATCKHPASPRLSGSSGRTRGQGPSPVDPLRITSQECGL